MAVYGGSIKVCATCCYWGGGRMPVNMGNNSKVKNYDNGICYHRNKYGAVVAENVSCHLWEKWPSLR